MDKKFQLKTYTLAKRSDVRLIEDWKLVADKYTTMENGGETEFDSVEDVKQFATNLTAEILKRNTVTFHPENIQPAGMELLRHSLESLIKGGIYLTEPHAGLIYEEKKSAIVKSREFQKLLDFNILVSKERAYGFIRFKKPKELTLKQFNELKDKHQISETEAFKWWPKLQQKGQGYIFYEVRDFIPYEESLLIKQVTGAQVFVDEVQFISKPYPQEHACRLRNPDDFKEGSFRRMNREHDGKRYSVILGRLKGETTLTEQAYRYDKEKWTASAGKSHCSEHDGTFEAAIEEERAEKQLTGNGASALVPPENLGQGVGNERLGVGGEDYCVCPECENRIKHERDIPCREVKCSKCGHFMVGEKEVQKVWEVPIIKSERQGFVYGIVLQPDIEDGQGDVISAKEIAKTAHQFMEDCQQMGIQHNVIVPEVKIWESYLAPQDLTIASEKVVKGSWLLGVHILDKKILDKVDSGELTGFSISGWANRREE